MLVTFQLFPSPLILHLTSSSSLVTGYLKSHIAFRAYPYSDKAFTRTRNTPPVQRQRGAHRTSAKAPASCAAHFYLTTLKAFQPIRAQRKRIVKVLEQFMSGLLHRLAQSYCLAFFASSKNPTGTPPPAPLASITNPALEIT